jgi:hypothetical protein
LFLFFGLFPFFSIFVLFCCEFLNKTTAPFFFSLKILFSAVDYQECPVLEVVLCAEAAAAAVSAVRAAGSAAVPVQR